MKIFLSLFLLAGLTACANHGANTKQSDATNNNSALTLSDSLNSGELTSDVGANLKEWKLNTSLTLKQNVQRWASQASWKVIWKTSQDYPVKSERVYRGSLAGYDGVVAQLFKELSYNGSEIPLNLTFIWNSGVILVEDGGYHLLQTRGEQ